MGSPALSVMTNLGQPVGLRNPETALEDALFYVCASIFWRQRWVFNDQAGLFNYDSRNMRESLELGSPALSVMTNLGQLVGPRNLEAALKRHPCLCLCSDILAAMLDIQ